MIKWIIPILVETMGVEPTTSRMRTERSPTELRPHILGCEPHGCREVRNS